MPKLADLKSVKRAPKVYYGAFNFEMKTCDQTEGWRSRDFPLPYKQNNAYENAMRKPTALAVG